MLFHILFIAGTAAILIGFLSMVAYEERRGQRVVLGGIRYRFDTTASKFFFVAKHVDWGAFIYELTRSTTERVLHDVAHTSLLAVHFVERQLTRLVRTLRSRQDDPLLSARSSDRPSRLERATRSVRNIVRRTRKEGILQFPSQKTDAGRDNQ